MLPLLSRLEALRQIKKSLAILDEYEREKGSKERIVISNLFVDVEDHKEINPLYLELNMLKYIDFSLVSFKEVVSKKTKL